MNFYENILTGLDDGNVTLSSLSKSLTAGELKTEIARYEALLDYKDLKGKAVAVLVNVVEEYIPLFFAVNKLNATLVPVSLQSRTDDLLGVLNSLDPHIIFTINELSGFSFSTLIKDWAEGRDTKTTIFTSDDCTTWDKTNYGRIEKSNTSAKGEFVTFSSGSTGQPKGIVFGNSIFDFTYDCLFKCWDLKPTDNMFIYAAISTFSAVVAMKSVIKAGSNLVVASEFDLVKMIETIEKTNTNKVMTTPSIFKSLYNFASRLKPEVLKKLELVCFIGEKVTPSILKAFPLIEDCTFVTLLGSSEAGAIGDGVITDNGDEEIVLTLFDEAEYKVVDGELWLKTGSMFTEYYNNPVTTQEAFEDGWFKTGDLVEFPSDRTFKIVGRKKDVIKKAGRQVISNEIETFLQQIEGIKNVAVVGVPHDIYGEQIVAFVVADGVTTKDIRSYCSGRISAYKIPDKVIFIDEMPLISNKIDKVKLKSLI
ncbi:class I adenylate-forming enzyme family protein [Bacillus sp. JJ1533]|uniref:class I adenylate-forming enzyme family protein n=1 Tax=Bacillus sp. JJ1533 TaxID=3122959 RepID=UPI0030000E94